MHPDDHSLARTVAAGHHRAAGCDVSRLAVVTDQAQSSVQDHEATPREARAQEEMPQDAMPQEAVSQEATPGTIVGQMESAVVLVASISDRHRTMKIPMVNAVAMAIKVCWHFQRHNRLRHSDSMLEICST